MDTEVVTDCHSRMFTAYQKRACGVLTIGTTDYLSTAHTLAINRY